MEFENYQNDYWNMYPEMNQDNVPEGKSPLPDYKPKKAYAKVGLGVFFFVLFFNLVVFVGQLAIMVITDEENISIAQLLLTNLVAEACVALPVYYLIIRKVPSVVPEKKSMGFGGIISALCMMYAISICGSILSSFVNSFLADATGKVSTSGLEVLFDNDFVITALYCVVVAPIVEELVFRKFLVDKLQVYSRKYTIILSGLLFGLMHGNLEQLFFTFFLGTFFAFIYVRTGKIRYTIILHFLMNGISTMLQYFMSKLTFFDQIDSLTSEQIMDILLKDEAQLIAFFMMAIITVLIYLFAIIGVALFIAKRKKFTLNSPGQYITAREAFFNYGMILAFVLLIGLLVLSIVLA
ncbi:MAG: CPBP family intramembrane metalloprotease [Lachnospiraceae bacterium]|nr:CPBP family intramembrane metalloprotease [Lachnospiraceae bacterium]